MICPICGQSNTVVETRKGASNRYRCRACMVDFSDDDEGGQTEAAESDGDATPASRRKRR